ncbi:DnaA ATPase domain-containing protein [Streptomyces aureus]|uniref:DnaA ATPase domain-containing protein n=1 Tax=Streptomyces aureus TaxID=193461 RepID=UPI0033CDBF66
MKSLEPLSDTLEPEAGELAAALRQLFESLGVGVRRYAARRSRDAGAVSRYLNGTRVPTWEFVADLLGDVAEIRGAVTPAAVELLRRLHQSALAASGTPQHQLQLLELQLADADRAARRSAMRERALEDALLDAQHRIADVELQLRQITAAPSNAESDGAVWGHRDEFASLRQERDQLKDQVEDLRAELKDAHLRRVAAEQRCGELEREIDSADKSSGPDIEVQHAELPPATESFTNAAKKDSGIIRPAGLNSKYTFENFAVSSSNRFTYGATIRAAELTWKNSNPLCLLGAAGKGKTHLLHAIGNYHHTLYPKSRIFYTSMGDLVREVRGQRGPTPARKSWWWTDADLLLIDDFERLQWGPQGELIDLFRQARDASAQIVFASPYMPKEEPDLSLEAISFLQEGLTLGMERPDREQLVSIIKRALRQEVGDARFSAEAVEFMADASTSMRELEGAIARVIAYSKIHETPVNTTTAQKALRSFHSMTKEVTGENVIRCVADHFGVTVEDLRARNRSRALVGARHIAMYLCRTLTDHSVPTIAALLGSKDLIAVLHADKKTQHLMRDRRSVYHQIEEITNRLLGSGDDFTSP